MAFPLLNTYRRELWLDFVLALIFHTRFWHVRGETCVQPREVAPVALGQSLLQSAHQYNRKLLNDDDPQWHPSTDMGPTSSTSGMIDCDLLIVIPSRPSEAETRSTVRATWMQYLNSSECQVCREHVIKVVFLVNGNSTDWSLHAERDIYSDIAFLEDFSQEDVYVNLASKVRHSLKFAVAQYSFRLLLKVDSDSWVFVDRLIRFLDRHQVWKMPRVYLGNFASGRHSKPILDNNSRLYDPVFNDMTDMETYPLHAKGAGYLLSHDLCEFIATSNVEFVNLPVEDVSVGLWLAAINLTRIHVNVSLDATCPFEHAIQSEGQDVLEPLNRTSTDHEEALVDHSVYLDMMRSRWQSYLHKGDPCAWPEWVAEEWTDCFLVEDGHEVEANRSRYCGEGYLYRAVKCTFERAHACDAGLRPQARKVCHVPCSNEDDWEMTKWSSCPTPCHKHALRTRNVTCRTGVAGGECTGASPVRHSRCPSCKWQTSEWLAGPALPMTRRVWCEALSNDDCDDEERPHSQCKSSCSQAIALRLSPSEDLDLNSTSNESSSNDSLSVNREGEYACKGLVRNEPSPSVWHLSATYSWTGLIVIESEKLMICVPPKNGCTQWKLLAEKMMGKSNYGGLLGEVVHEDVHNPKKNGLVYMHDLPRDTQLELLNDKSWKKVVVTRDPFTRILSAYKDKIIKNKDLYREPIKNRFSSNDELDSPRTFRRFLDMLQSAPDHLVDEHFRRQSAFCGLRSFSYDAQIHFENLRAESKEFLTSYGLWEKYGESGWGRSGTDEFLSEYLSAGRFGFITNHSSFFTDMYSDEKIRQDVRSYFEEDFQRFCYSDSLPSILNGSTLG